MDGEEIKQGEFDWSPALSFLDDDRELLREVVEVFLDECPRLTSAMNEAIERRDGPELQLAAHAMKSAMQTFGMPGAADAALELETLGRQSEFAEAPRYLAELQSHLDAMLPAASALLQNTASC
jgi:HPt (histidine-containing phosphotransfer) domain-containing protein